jgi:hypothetical protein
LKRARRLIRRSAGHHAAVVAIDQHTRATIVALEQMRARLLWALDTGAGEPPRRAGDASSIGLTKVVSEGGYRDGCGAPLRAWTPGAFDRVAEATWRGWPVRVAVPAEGADVAVLDRWLREVADPAALRFVTASDMAGMTLADLGATPTTGATAPTLARRVDADAWRQAAEALVGAWALPRSLPGGLNPSEAFLALALVLAAEEPPTTLELGALEPPVEVARSTLLRKVSLDPREVAAAARALDPAGLHQVPAVVTVGDHTLTAAEFLRAMALTVLGETPEARPIADPDPFAPGGGWGRSG